jgi:RimJ/RimL family protein N-acetyltransferase
MDLIEATDADFADLVEGRAPRSLRIPADGVEAVGVLVMLRDLAKTIRPGFSPASWMMVEAGEVVGLCSIVRQPSGSAVDIGYGVSPDRRGNGLASAAVGAVLEWARLDERVQCIRAETSIHNMASQRVLERNGFERVGERRDDEDGDLLCWRVATTG